MRHKDTAPTSEIHGFRVTGFRTLQNVSFEIAGKVAVICGPNNVGKSSLLRILGIYPEALRFIQAGRASNIELFQEMNNGRVGVALSLDSPAFVSLLESKIDRPEDVEGFTSAIAETDCRILWGDIIINKGQPQSIDADPLDPLGRLFNEWHGKGGAARRWIQAIAALGGQGNLQPPAARQQWFKEASQKTFAIPEVRHITDIRRSVDQPLTDDELRNLVVASAYSTTGVRREEWAHVLEEVLQDVFGEDVRFQARPTDDGPGELLLAIDGETDIPVEEVGAGVREVVAIAFRALSSGGADMLTIEEPENCLHPAAVRRLVRSLAERVDVQVILSTHSAAVVNARPDAVVELRREGTETNSWLVSDAGSRFRAIRALGHEPADLVMTPCAVWVEGPSDRNYLNAWLSNEGLREGIDYQVAFFGGAIGANVSLSAEALAEALFAEVRPLSRRCVFVADSDRSSAKGALKSHVRRWRSETKDDPDATVLWTWGREIENSLPPEVVNDYRASRNKRRIPEDQFRFSRVLSGLSVPKAKLSQIMLERARPETPTNAVGLVKDLARFIRESSD